MWAGGDVYVANSFLCHQRPNMFSVRDSMVRSLMLKESAIIAWWSTLTASSGSLLVTWLDMLPQ